MNFNELNVSPELLDGLQHIQHEKPTDLEQSVLPAIFDGGNLLLKAEPGKDKNGVIVISALQKYFQIEEENKEDSHILILTPHANEARELDELVRTMGNHADVGCALIDSDGNPEKQRMFIADRIPVLVANPGRLLDLLEENLFIFRHLDFLIIDRLEEMLSDGLESVLKDINKRIVSDPQKLLISGKMNKDVKSFANFMLDEPTLIGFDLQGNNGQALAGPPAVNQDLSQGYINVPSRMKITTLMAHIDSSSSENCVIFTASKRGTDRLYRVLRKRGLKATSLHGKLSDEKRAQRFANFTNGDVQYLLVADVPAAELSLDKIKQVINYDVPNDPDEYRYRANLVGSGKAARIVSLVSKQDRSDISQLRNELGQAPEELPLPDVVHKKLEQRKKKNKSGGGSGRNRNKSKNNNKKTERPKKGEGGNKKSQKDKMELPRPSYDKLSGGRTGNDKDERTGVVEFFKKLFS